MAKSMTSKTYLSIIIPTLNEEQNLPIVLKELKNFLGARKFRNEIIIVDAYSQDKTVEIAKSHGCKIIYDKPGKGSALRKGMAIARGNIIITMDADCSNIASEIGLLAEGINAGYDICMGSRFIQGGGTDDMQFYRAWGNKFFVLLVNTLWKTHYSDLCYGYRSFRKSCIKELGLKSDGFGIETEISIKAAKRKLRVLEVPSREKKRKYGQGNLRTFRDGSRILKTIASEMVKG